MGLSSLSTWCCEEQHGSELCVVRNIIGLSSLCCEEHHGSDLFVP